MNTIGVSNSLDLDQAQHFVGPDLGPNCLQRLSAEDTSRQRVKEERHLSATSVYKKRLIHVNFLSRHITLVHVQFLRNYNYNCAIFHITTTQNFN